MGNTYKLLIGFLLCAPVAVFAQGSLAGDIQVELMLNRRAIELFDVREVNIVNETYASDHLPLVGRLVVRK